MQRHEVFNSLSHLVGAVGALVGGVVLIVHASQDGSSWRVVSFGIYATTLVLLYAMSTLYHGLSGRAKRLFRVFDHQAIYLLIAGTYTPFALVTLRDTVGWWVFGMIWATAALGVVVDAIPRRGLRIAPVVIYIAMGWSAVFILDDVRAALPTEAFAWLLTGGLFYTVGVAFYVLDHWYPWAHGVWHLFVLAGSVSHYIAILGYV